MRILVSDDLAGLIRKSYDEFRFVEWRIKTMEQPGSYQGKTGEYKQQCSEREQVRERNISMDYMRKIHGIEPDKKSAYKPVGRRKR